MSIPAGWYDDGHGQQRWWDGQNWTEHVQPPAAEAAPAHDESTDATAPADPAVPAESGVPVEPVVAPESAVAVEPVASAEPAAVPPAEPVAADPAAPVEPAAPTVPTEAFAPAAPDATQAERTPAYDPAAPYQPPVAPSYEAAAPASVTAPYETAPYAAAPHDTAAYPQPTQPYPPGAQAAPQGSGSKKWILWVVIGLVALMIVGGAFFFIISSLVGTVLNGMPASPVAPTTQQSETADDPLPSDTPTPPAEVAELTAAERAAAEDVVQRYDVAWSAGDCDEFFALTTEDFRGLLDIQDCATFAENSAAFRASVTDYSVTVTDAYRSDEWILVDTIEAGSMLVDENGEPLAEPQPFEDPYLYELLEVDGALKIDYVS